MIKRLLGKHLLNISKKYPIVTITGPRQSGKTTLAKAVFPKYKYVSLEDPDFRRFAEEDPRSFLSENNKHVILDEIQNVPELFSYIQCLVDEKPLNGRYILTGSQKFLLNERISQSLAGRCALLNLLPFSLSELTNRKPQNTWDKNIIKKYKDPQLSIYESIFKGFYPRVHDQKLDPTEWYKDYFNSYITRDVRALLNVGDLRSFEQFIRLLAGRSGQLLNLTSLGNDSGVTHTTVKRWISILEASYILTLIPPHYKNFNKRLIKAHKIYFNDSGLLCYLLRISSHKELINHPMLGNIFETFIISEFIKAFTHQGKEPPLYFWRDKTGNEIDLLVESGRDLFPVEIKASQTISSDFIKNIKTWFKLPQNTQNKGAIVYGGGIFQKRGNIQIIPWYAVS